MRDLGRTQHSPRIPSDRSWSEVTREEFAHAVQTLPKDVRNVFELQAFGRQAYDQIAAQLEISRATVGARLRQARCLLEAALMPTSRA
jgi:RNA polymerase sigma factor (sigma-70 family)